MDTDLERFLLEAPERGKPIGFASIASALEQWGATHKRSPNRNEENDRRHPRQNLSQSPSPCSGTIYLVPETNSTDYPTCKNEVNESANAGASAFVFTIPIVNDEGRLERAGLRSIQTRIQ